jgi:uncharacterized delta-60 repeat protein
MQKNQNTKLSKFIIAGFIIMLCALTACGDTYEGYDEDDYGGSSAPAGSLDTTFGGGDGKVTTDFGGVDDWALALGIDSDGKIVVAGASDDGTGDFALARYTIDGILDTTFGTGGKATTDIGGGDWVNALGFQSSGKIVVAGVSDGDFALARYNSNGSLDTTFGTLGIVTTDIGTSSDDWAGALGIQSGDKIVVAGESAGDFALARYTVDGILDTTFGGGDGKVTTNIGGTDWVNALGFQSSGKIVVAGVSDGNFALARYTVDGILDTTFGIGGTDGDGIATTDIGTSSDDYASALGIQSGDKIVVAGESDGNFALARYNSNGSIDTDFGTLGKVTTDFGGDDEAYALGFDSDGKIVTAGASDDGSDYDFALARYTADGILDTTFGTGGKVTTDIGTSSDDYAEALGIQSGDKIVVAGYSDDGAGGFALARYWP